MIQLNYHHEKAPSTNLAAFVKCFWETSITIGNGYLHTENMLPYGFTELTFYFAAKPKIFHDQSLKYEMTACSIGGLMSHGVNLQFDRSLHAFGIRLHPVTLYLLTGIPQTELTDRIIHTADIFGKHLPDFSDEMMAAQHFQGRVEVAQKWIWKLLMQSKHDGNRAMKATAIMTAAKGQVNIQELSQQFGVSDRQIERDFKEKVGMSPKHFARILRINHAFALLNSGKAFNWMDISYLCGYYDQAHFTNEFKHFVGLTPNAFLKMRGLEPLLWEVHTSKAEKVRGAR